MAGDAEGGAGAGAGEVDTVVTPAERGGVWLDASCGGAGGCGSGRPAY